MKHNADTLYMYTYHSKWLTCSRRGVLFATGVTSLAESKGRFLLASSDVFGVLPVLTYIERKNIRYIYTP